MGFGAEIAAVVQHQAFDWLDAPVERVGAKFAPLPFAPVMEEYVVPHARRRARGDQRARSGAMATEVKLPRLGQGMESGTIVKWLKSEGDQVEKGEPLYELDTDKVTQEVEAEAPASCSRSPSPRARSTSARRSPSSASRARTPRRGSERRAQPRSTTSRRKDRRPAREAERERGREASASEQIAEVRAPATATAPAAGSRRRRWRAGSPASAGSTSRSLAAPAPRGASSPRTSSAPRPRTCRAARRRRRPAGEVEVDPAHVSPQDDRPPPDRGLAGAGVPDRDVGRHDASAGAARAACVERRRRARPSRRSPTSSRRPAPPR